MKVEDEAKGENAKRGMTNDDVYNKIKEMIYYNQLAPGQKIIYNDLAVKFNISATPVIQALKRLESSKLVSYVPNKGYFVAKITMIEARQLYQTREALEIYIIPEVIRNLTRENLKEMKESFKKYEGSNRRVLIMMDAQFHLKIAHYANNEVIYHLLEDIFEKIYLKYRLEYLDDNWIKRVVKTHRELLGALAEKNAEEAERITRNHIQLGMEHVVESLHSERNISI